jgi:hypothetical protein
MRFGFRSTDCLEEVVMKSFRRFVGLFALIVVAGCASTNVTQQTPMSNPGLARPNQIWVYNFVANPADMPANSSIGGEVGRSWRGMGASLVC